MLKISLVSHTSHCAICHTPSLLFVRCPRWMDHLDGVLQLWIYELVSLWWERQNYPGESGYFLWQNTGAISVVLAEDSKTLHLYGLFPVPYEDLKLPFPWAELSTCHEVQGWLFDLNDNGYYIKKHWLISLTENNIYMHTCTHTLMSLYLFDCQ